MTDSTSEMMDDGMAVRSGMRALGISEKKSCRFSTAAALLVAARAATTRALICILKVSWMNQ